MFWDVMVTAFETAEIYVTDSGAARVLIDDEFFRDFPTTDAAENWLWKRGFRF